jgi:aminopeptidase N
VGASACSRPPGRARGLALLAIALCLLPEGAARAAPFLPAPCKRFESLVLKAEPTPPRTDDRGVDILSYDLDLVMDPAPGPAAGVVALTGRVDIGLRAVRGGVTSLPLDLVSQLTCDGVVRAGQALPFVQSGEELLVTWPAPLSTTAPETLTITWHGRPPRHGNLYVGMMYRRDDNGTPADPADDTPFMFTVSEPWSAHAWWPCKDHPADKARVSLAATVPQDLTVVSNGTLESVTDAAPGWKRFLWRERYPLPTYLVSVAASRYETWREDCRPPAVAPVPLDYHVIARDRARAEIDFGNTCAMMGVLTGLLGPYPFAGEKYAQVEVVWGGAMEHTTATSIGQYMFTGDRRYEQVVVHEMAHQWFGDSLTPLRWSDIWLNEGFATYAEALWLEASQGPAAREAFLRQIGPARHADLFVGDGTLIDPSPILPNTLVYDKGAWVLHMLRGVIGDEAFFRFLRDWVDDPARVQGSVGVEDMIRVAEAAGARDLGAFFDGWLRTDAAPVLSLTPQPGTRGGRRTATATLRQLQDRPLTVPVPLLLHLANGRKEPVTALLEDREQTFRWTPGSAVDSVTVDPDRALLARWAAAPPPALVVTGPAPNPAPGTGTWFTLFLNNSSQVTVEIYDVRGRLLDSTPLGTVPAAGPGDAGVPWRWEPGRSVPAGVCWLAFRSGDARVVRQVVLVR